MDIKEIRRELEELKLVGTKRTINDAAPGPDVDSLQNSIDRLVHAIDSEHDNVDSSLKELNTYRFDPLANGTISEFEEKEITIPAGYGWKTIDLSTYTFTDDDIGKKIKTSSMGYIGAGLIAKSGTNYSSWMATETSAAGGNESSTTLVWSSTLTKLSGIIFNQSGQINYSSQIFPISKFEMWDVVTPSSKEITLIKK